MRRPVFICSPYAGDVEKNKRLARHLCRKAIESGFAPYAPHLYLPDILDDDIPEQRTIGIDCGLAFIGSCNALFYCAPNGITLGMQREIKYAESIGVNVHEITYSPQELEVIYELA